MENNSNSVTKLSNGITLYHREFTNTPLAGMTFKIHLNNNEKSGLPHLIEHVLVNQTKAPEFIKLTGSTDRNAVSIKMMGNSTDLVKFSQYFFNQLFEFNISTENVQAEKAVIFQEIKQYGNSRLEKFANIARNCSFQVSSLFDDEVLGNFKNITEFSVEDIHEFLDTHLIKENISVLIVGNDSSLHQMKSILTKYNLRKSAFATVTNIFSKSQSLSLEKTVIGDPNNKKLSQLSTIFKIDSEQLNQNKILALSMLFSLLNSGSYSLLSQMQQFAPELYFFQAIPIFRKSSIYGQLLTSCSIKDTETIEKNISGVFVTLSNLDSSILNDVIHNLHFQQNLLFDGVEKSISSFATMPSEQEKIINLYDIDSIATINKFKEIINALIDQPVSTVITYI